MLKAGFAKEDITPRVGVELCGFGPFIHRYSIGVRDPLNARAMALSDGTETVVVVSCDLIGITIDYTRQIRKIVQAKTGVPESSIMVHCTHTHSGPAVRQHNFVGWGEADLPYLTVLPHKIARACIRAINSLQQVELCYTKVPCEGIGLNREYDKDAPPLDEVLQEDWRPDKPEKTDTICHVATFIDQNQKLAGFFSNFGCHPVVCCAQTRYLHGDFVGIAGSMLEREFPGSVGLFLQGAQGDVNSCVVHKPEAEAMLALDIIAARYARRVRLGISKAKSLKVDRVKAVSLEKVFSLKPFSENQIKQWLNEYETIFSEPSASDSSRDLRMKTVYISTLRNLLAKIKSGTPMNQPTELQGIRLGPISLLGSPFEIFQAIKNDIIAEATAEIPLVLGLTNDTAGYAPDRQTAGKGGYADRTVPMIHGRFPYADIHGELKQALLELDNRLNDN